jgi:hypothetical protein
VLANNLDRSEQLAADVGFQTADTNVDRSGNPMRSVVSKPGLAAD